MKESFPNFELGCDTPVDSLLQREVESIDTDIRSRHGINPDQTAVGIFDARTSRLAMLRPDSEFYGASVPKIAILLAFFQLRPDAALNLDASTKHELGLMIKASSNEFAAKFSKLLGLKEIQRVLASYQLYDTQHGGGIWVGKHYGQTGERVGSPVGDNSHAATVRQLLRFYLLLQQDRLVSPEACAKMLDIFASPQIPHDNNKFVKALSGRGLSLLRKSGWWEDWLHDTAIITGPDRHYILVALTRHPRGDNYLEAFATAVDDLMIRK